MIGCILESERAANTLLCGRPPISPLRWTVVVSRERPENEQKMKGWQSVLTLFDAYVDQGYVIFIQKFVFVGRDFPLDCCSPVLAATRLRPDGPCG